MSSGDRQEKNRETEDPQKDPSPRTSAALWMETLAMEKCFTCFEKEKGGYYGFSTPWQLDQSLIYCDVVTLDQLMDI